MCAKKAATKKSAKKSAAKPKIKTVEETASGVVEVGEKKAKKSKTKPAKADGKLSAIDAAAKLLSTSKEPMTTKQMIDGMASKGWWTSPGGKTPHATLYSAILRELATKGKEARFVKTERGKFASKG